MQKINKAHSGDFCELVRKADFNNYLHSAAMGLPFSRRSMLSYIVIMIRKVSGRLGGDTDYGRKKHKKEDYRKYNWLV